MEAMEAHTAELGLGGNEFVQRLTEEQRAARVEILDRRTTGRRDRLADAPGPVAGRDVVVTVRLRASRAAGQLQRVARKLVTG